MPHRGIEYGSAPDGRRIYVAEGDTPGKLYTLGGSGPYAGQTAHAGSWAALAPVTGKILWQTPDPGGAFDTSFVSAANGVVYAGSLAVAGTSCARSTPGRGHLVELRQRRLGHRRRGDRRRQRLLGSATAAPNAWSRALR